MAATAQQSRFPGTALAYITIGGLLAVMSGTSYVIFGISGNKFVSYLQAVTLIGGVGMVVLGFCVGFIGRVARVAELPPADAPKATLQAPAAGASTSNPPPGMVAAAAAPTQHA